MDFAGAYSSANLSFLIQGLWITLEVAAISIVLSFAIGILLALLRYAKIPVVSQIVMLWVELMRNLPLLLIIFFAYFALPETFHFKITEIQAAIGALTVFESAMIAEIIRSGLNSIPKGQIEASRSSGLTYMQTLRFIVLPQALRRMIPPLVSQFISLLKDTSLAIIISLPELLHNGQIVYNQSQSYVFPTLILVALIYFAVNYCLSLIAGRLERRYSN